MPSFTNRLLLSIALCAALSAAQSSSGSSGSSSAGQSGSGQASSGQSGSGAPAAPANPSPGWAETGPAPIPALGQGGGEGGGAPAVNPTIADYLAPISRMRWGPFSVLGWDAFASWSNQPIGLNGNTGPAQLATINGVQQPTQTFGYHIGTQMGARWRWGRGFIGLQYAPSVDYQSATAIRQINWQNVSLVMDRPFRFGKWRFSMGVRSAAVTTYGEIYNPPTLVPLTAFQVPISNIDLVGLLNEPEPLQPPKPQDLFMATRFYTGSASMALTREMGPRDSLSFSVAAQLNHTLNFGQDTGNLLNYPQSSGGIAGLTYSHKVSPRAQWSVQARETQVFGPTFYVNRTSEQSVQLLYSWTPWRRFSFQAGAGPGRLVEPQGLATFTYVATATVAFTPFTGSTIVTGYSRQLDPTGFSGGTQQNHINLTWAAPQPKGHKWRYGLVTNFLLGNSSQGLGAQPGTYATGASASVIGSYSYPITRAMSLSANYGYFFQHLTNIAPGTAYPSLFKRHIASVGIHYSFGLQGAGGGELGGASGGLIPGVGSIGQSIPR